MHPTTVPSALLQQSFHGLNASDYQSWTPLALVIQKCMPLVTISFSQGVGTCNCNVRSENTAALREWRKSSSEQFAHKTLPPPLFWCTKSLKSLDPPHTLTICLKLYAFLVQHVALLVLKIFDIDHLVSNTLSSVDCVNPMKGIQKEKLKKDHPSMVLKLLIHKVLKDW